MRKIIRFLVRKVPRPVLIRLSLILRKPVAFFYKGNNVECNICGKTFKKFLPYGKDAGENRLCPNCLSLERHRLLWKYLNEKTEFFTSSLKVLHIAPEQPFIKRFKKIEGIKYTTADLVSPIADVKTDIRNMKEFEDNIFDFIICNHVMEHIDEEQKAFSEIKRILKPDGKAIMQVPIDYNLNETYEDLSITSPKEREKHFGQYDHVRQYALDYPERIRKSGLEVLEDDFIKTLSKEEIARFRFDANEIIYLISKKI